MISCFLLCKQVNILTHTDIIKLKAQRVTAIEKKKRSLTIKEHNRNQDSHASKKKKKTSTEDKVCEIPITLELKYDDLPFVESNQPEGAALWDIFRREDVNKLKEYLMKHSEEFRHANYEPVEQVITDQLC
jgi:lysine-specific demethylase 3